MYRRTGILLIHGLMGSPREYGLLQERLRQEGYQTRTISLPGHGDLRHRPLHDFTAKDLIIHCAQEYMRFAEGCDHIIVVGHSLGGICTLLTAADQPEKLSGIVSLAAPYEHAYSVNRPMDLFSLPMDVLLPGVRYVPEHYTGFERPYMHPWLFPKLVREADIMLSYLQERISRIYAPVLLGHSPYDLIIPYNEMDKLANNLVNSSRVITYTFEQCGHQIFPNSRESENAVNRILHFIREECDQAGEQIIRPAM